MEFSKYSAVRLDVLLDMISRKEILQLQLIVTYRPVLISRNNFRTESIGLWNGLFKECLCALHVV